MSGIDLKDLLAVAAILAVLAIVLWATGCTVEVAPNLTECRAEVLPNVHGDIRYPEKGSAEQCYLERYEVDGHTFFVPVACDGVEDLYDPPPDLSTEVSPVLPSVQPESNVVP